MKWCFVELCSFSCRTYCASDNETTWKEQQHPCPACAYASCLWLQTLLQKTHSLLKIDSCFWWDCPFLTIGLWLWHDTLTKCVYNHGYSPALWPDSVLHPPPGKAALTCCKAASTGSRAIEGFHTDALQLSGHWVMGSGFRRLKEGKMQSRVISPYLINM